MIDKAYAKIVDSANLQKLEGMLNRMDKERYPEHFIYIMNRINILKNSEEVELTKTNPEPTKDNQDQNNSGKFNDSLESNNTPYQTESNKAPTKLRLYILYYLFKLLLSIILIIWYFSKLNNVTDYSEFIILIFSLTISILVSLSVIINFRKKSKNKILSHLLVVICFDISVLIFYFIKNNFNFDMLREDFTNVAFFMNILFYYHLSKSEKTRKYFESEEC